MSTDTGGHAPELERRVMEFLTRNFPQIRMHGGSASVEALDPETGEIHVRLGGACSGCGISPMTTRAIESRLPGAIPEIEHVTTETGGIEGSADDPGGTVPSFPDGDADEDPDEDVGSPF